MTPDFEIKRINALHKLNVLDTERDSDFDQITKMVSIIFDAPMSFISMVDRDRLFFKSGFGTDVKEMDRRDSFCSAAIEQKTALIVNDASKDRARFSSWYLMLCRH
ncbi:hypothetical protein CJF42_06315 [Pseudoalteromonas sp. NBT06-2]|uniref:GAF domain-containing protein n=1 Tax=Pseudoalteromonas sp. NBT06-2 TaxID=2025950 RepID=UPI000BA7C1FE|nr:hypothetical protein [Pseudoalteromonas sp. NBT06-2]PAJ75259.1 hypothetical protein CJF42_06315 [Pseudoalteromonas sp. NBT06-2]